jgi:hypothetical protein
MRLGLRSEARPVFPYTMALPQGTFRSKVENATAPTNTTGTANHTDIDRALTRDCSPK